MDCVSDAMAMGSQRSKMFGDLDLECFRIVPFRKGPHPIVNSSQHFSTLNRLIPLIAAFDIFGDLGAELVSRQVST